MHIPVSRRSLLFGSFSLVGLVITTQAFNLLSLSGKILLVLREGLSFITDKGIAFSTASPESQGIDPTKLNAVKTTLAEKKTKTFLVLKNDQLVYEWYASDYSITEKHYVASAAKAVAGSLALAIAIEDGLLTLDTPVSTYVTQWANDPQKSQITVEHLARHTSGLENAEVDGDRGPHLPGWKGRYWRKAAERWKIAIEEAPMLFSPATAYTYSNLGTTILSYTLAKALDSSPLNNAYKALRQRIMKPLGIPDYAWSIGYRQAYNADGVDLFYIDGGATYTARALARIGQLMLGNGQWQGKQLLASQSVQTLVSYAAVPPPETLKGQPAPGILWHTNADKTFPSLPVDAFLAIGRGYQVLCVIPSLNLITVRMGGMMNKEDWTAKGWKDFDQTFFAPLMAALNPQ